MFSFPFLFPRYCPSVGHRAVSIISNGCDQSYFMFFHEVIESLYRWINAVFNAGKSFFPSFLDTYSLSTSSLGCNGLCMVISFCFFFVFFFFVHLFKFFSGPLKTGPKYLTRDTAQVFIPLVRFSRDSFVSSSLLVLLRYSFWIFSFIPTCSMVSASKLPKYLYLLLLLLLLFSH